MSKQHLPDEILDAVSGGVFTFKGEPVTAFSYDEQGVSWTVGGKSHSASWSDDEKSWIAQNPDKFAMDKKVLEALQASPTGLDMEQVDSWFNNR